MQLTIHGFRLYSFSLLFAGLSIFFSSLFTALNNGLVSAILSASRVILFQIPAVLLMPLIWKLTVFGCRSALAEELCVLFGIYFLIKYRNKYGYLTDFNVLK